MTRITTARDYAEVLALADVARAMGLSREEAMSRCVDLLWGAFANRPLSWVGFYEKNPDADEMVLLCREPKPACSPIELHGMCGRSWRERRPIIIDDVRTLGANYIACDPKDLGELVVPVMNADGSCWGVLDADSYEVGVFNEGDVAGFAAILERMGISTGAVGVSPTLKL